MRTEGFTLIEPVPIEDDYCSGLARVEDADGNARFVLYATQTCFEAETQVCVVKRKIILPMRAIRPGIEMTLAFLARRTAVVAGQHLLRLVT